MPRPASAAALQLDKVQAQGRSELKKCLARERKRRQRISVRGKENNTKRRQHEELLEARQQRLAGSKFAEGQSSKLSQFNFHGCVRS